MFVDKPIGNPLERKQLKWLLVVLGLVMIGVVLFLSFRLMNEPAQIPATQPMSDKGVAAMKPTLEEVSAQLEMLAKKNAENPAPKPTQEEIAKQLEMLSKE